MPTKSNDWVEYKRMVIAFMEDSKKQNEQILKELASLKTEVTTLKVKAALWGSAAAAFVSLVIKKVF